MLASKFIQGTSSMKPDIFHSKERSSADGLLAGGSQEEKEEGTAAEGQSLASPSLRLLWKQERYSQMEVCCSQLAILESKGIHGQGDQYDPYIYR